MQCLYISVEQEVEMVKSMTAEVMSRESRTNIVARHSEIGCALLRAHAMYFYHIAFSGYRGLRKSTQFSYNNLLRGLITKWIDADGASIDSNSHLEHVCVAGPRSTSDTLDLYF